MLAVTDGLLGAPRLDMGRANSLFCISVLGSWPLQKKKILFDMSRADPLFHMSRADPRFHI